MTSWRIRAALVDLGLVLAWVVVVGAVSLPLYLAGPLAGLRPLPANLLAAALVILPVIVVLALLEGGRYEASPGKQWVGLRVRRQDGNRLGFPRSLLRNAVKVALPWALGHAAVLAWASAVRPVGVDVWVLTAVALLLPAGSTIAAVLGHAPHDILAGSRVLATAPGRRVAQD